MGYLRDGADQGAQSIALTGSGGSSGQASDAGHIHGTPLTTTGDILTVFGGALVRQGVGNNNTHLIANSGASNGIQWSRPNLWLRPEDAGLDSATLVAVGASPALSHVINYADAATQGAYWSFPVPYDWNSGVLTAQIYWSPGSTDATSHTVRWSMRAISLASGADVTGAGTTTTFTGASAARTVNLLVKDTATSTGVTPAAAGDLFRFELQRIGADAADTYVGAARVHGILITY
jgi:hypothetical protein